MSATSFDWKNLFLLILVSTLFSCTSEDTFQKLIGIKGSSFDILITNGNLLNGLDTLPYQADILIRNDSILFIGEVDTSRIVAEQLIDATGKYITPGFIDTHAHGNPLKKPDFENFLAMGVTTICLGQDGGSPDDENIRTWMHAVDSIGTGVNIAMFVGHGTLRELSGVGYKPDPEPQEQSRMEELLADALKAGCFGMTTGLEYTPGTYAVEEELAALARIVGANGGLIMSHVRNEDNDAIEASIMELVHQGQYCNVHVSHLKVVYGKGEERAEEILSLLEGARRESEYRVTADIYPYTASYTGIGIVFPQWAKPPNDYEQVKQQRKQELLAFLRQKISARNGPGATLFGTAPYAGKTLAEVASEQARPFEEVLLDIGPEGASGAYFVMDEALQGQLLEDPQVMICSDGSPTMHHPRGYGSFPKIIEQYVFREQRLSLPEAVRKMCSLPAQTLGLSDRGVIREGYHADLLVFDPEKVRAQATYSDPHQLGEGMDWVIVNGKVAFRDGQMVDRAGRVLRK